MSERTCNIEGCDRQSESRGLCGKHYYWLKSTDRAKRAAAEAAADAPRHKGSPPVRVATKPAEHGQGGGTKSDEVVSAAREVATGLGITHVAHKGGWLFLGGQNTVYMNPGGKVVPAEIVIGGDAG